MTSEWFSLRSPENERQNRRVIHPWWQSVQAIAPHFGEEKEITRLDKNDVLQSAGWYIQHVAGMLPSFAARMGIRDIHEAAHQLANDVTCYWYERDFFGTYDKRLLRLGFAARFCPGGEGEKPAKSECKCDGFCSQKCGEKCACKCTEEGK